MIRETLETYAKYNAKEWSTDRSQTVGASEIGQCARKTYFAKNLGDHEYGTVEDESYEDRWGAKVRGTYFEDHFWAPAMKARFGERLLLSGPEQRTLVSEFLSATPDGLIVDLTPEEKSALQISDDSTCVDLDCKTIDPRSKLLEAKPEHVYQVHVQIGLIRELTNHKPTYGILSYTDASFWDDVKEFTVRFDPEIYEHAKHRAAQIMTARSAADVKPEGIIAGGKECGYCPFTTACGVERSSHVPHETKDVDAKAAEEIATIAAEAKRLKNEAAAKEKQAKELEFTVKELLAQAGTKKLAAHGVNIIWSPVKGRPSWDNKGLREAAEAAGVDLSKFETAGDPSDRLVITING